MSDDLFIVGCDECGDPVQGYVCDPCIERIRAEARAGALEEAAQMAELLDGVTDGEYTGPIIPYSFTELAADFRVKAKEKK